MKQSSRRILTTHVGSLPRPPDLLDALLAEEERAVYTERTRERVRSAVAEIVRKQVEAGVDVVGDGEMGKPSYATYVDQRLGGFGERSDMPLPADLREFPGYAAQLMGSEAIRSIRIEACVDRIEYLGEERLQSEIDDFREAVVGAPVQEAFLTAASPGVIALFHVNRFYPSHERYLEAIAEAMRHEYRAIVDAGFLLQLDCPDLAMGRHIQFPDVDEATFLRYARMHVDALDFATENIPADRMRMHLCWGNYEGPHHHDVPLRSIAELVVSARPAGISFEAANPRHEHEWRVWSEIDLPDDKVLLPGVIDSTTNFIEHPDLVASRIERYAGIVGSERVIASTDCGFATFAAMTPVDPEIVWAKLETLAAGARRATGRLWRPVAAAGE